jgi:hypothetical protein
MPNAGLSNTGVTCYSNAIFQALASCNHLTTFFDTPPQQNHSCPFLVVIVISEMNNVSIVMLAKYYCCNMVPICRSTKCHSIMPFHQCAIPPMCHSTNVLFHLCAIPPMCHSLSAILPFRHSAILPFLQNAIPPFCHSAIPPICHYSNIPTFIRDFNAHQCQAMHGNT